MNKTVVVTGASGGVGRATARAFGSSGWNVGLLARGEDGVKAAAAETRQYGAKALELIADTADAEAVDAAAGRVERELGPIDVWVNCAMTTVFSPVHMLTADEFRRVTEVTYLGYVHGTLAALKRMRPRNSGVIVQVGSALSYRAIPLQAAYCGAKFAIRGFTDSLRSELIHDGLDIHLTMVQMPALNTPQFDWCRNKMPYRPQPVPPIFEPEVAAEAIRFAAQARRREIWVGGSSIKAILGTKIAPGYLDRYLAQKAYDGQMTDEPARPDRPDNLFTPVPRDHGAHGRFDDRARPSSAALWITKHRDALALGALGVLGLSLLAGAAAARGSWSRGLRSAAKRDRAPPPRLEAEFG